jgi:hypothetical protein
MNSSHSDKTLYFHFDRPTNLDVGVYREGLQIGSEVAFFGFNTSGHVKFAEGGPGASVYVPAPQGLFIAGGDGQLWNVWAEESWPRLRTVDDLKTKLGRRST